MTCVPGDWVGDILHFWFDEIPREAWFGKDEAFDQRLRERFLAQHEHVAVLPVGNCVRDAETAMASVIALDQFPRNMFRGTPRAFATDAKGPGDWRSRNREWLRGSIVKGPAHFPLLAVPARRGCGSASTGHGADGQARGYRTHPLGFGTQGHHRSLRALSTPKQCTRQNVDSRRNRIPRAAGQLFLSGTCARGRSFSSLTAPARTNEGSQTLRSICLWIEQSVVQPRKLPRRNVRA
jgi:uncharacterized protein DUF924